MPTLPMFPLGTVLFPHMVLPLHVFEPRYRALMHDVLDDDRVFGITLITRGHEVGGGETRADVGSLARVVQAEELEDGRWLVITVGIERFRVERWLPDAPYPVAAIERLPSDGLDERDRPAFDGLVARLRRVLALRTELGEEGVASTFELADDPDVACWQVAVLAPLNPFDAQRVLETSPCPMRLILLDELLGELEATLELRLRLDGPS